MKNGPKSIKFKKIKKGVLKNLDLKNLSLKFGIIGLKTLESGILSANQIEALKQLITKKTQKKSKIWLNISLTVPVTKKPIGTRMGKGAGKFNNWSAKIKKGRVIVELAGINNKTLINTLKICKAKLPVKTKICYKLCS